MNRTCPGHTTQQKDSDSYFKHMGEMWIPNGAQYDSATTLSPEEQEKSALDDIAEERAADIVADRELDEKVAEALSRPDDEFARQAIAMLSKQFPKLSKEQIVQKFSSADHFATSTGGTQVFLNCRVVHVRAMLAGVLLGFIKALITEHEIFSEYVLIPTSEHSQGLVPHLYDALIHPHQHINMLRVQVFEQNRMEIAAYVGKPREAWNQRLRELCTAKETGKKKKEEKKATMRDQPNLGGMHLHTWVPPTKKGRIWGPLDVPETGAMLLADTVKNVLKAVEKMTNRTPLAQPIEVVIDGLDEKAVTEDVPDGTAFMHSRERDSDAEEPEEQLRNVTGRGHWGARSLINVLTMLLTGPLSPYMLAHNTSYAWHYITCHTRLLDLRAAHWTGEVVMPGSNSQYFLYKLTCDAARLMNAPRKFRVCTTVIAQLISAGVKGPWGTWGASIGQHMVEKPQSNLWAFCVATWFGKDNRPELETGIQPLFEEAMQLEDPGSRFNLTQSRAPWSYTRQPINSTTGNRPAGKLCGGPEKLCVDPGTKAFKHVMPRAWLVLGILMYSRLYVAVDGATHFSLTNVFCQSACPDAYTNEKKQELDLLLHIAPIHKGETLSNVCDRMLPGSSKAASRHHWYYKAAVMSNNHAENTEAGATTRLPPRKESTRPPMKKSLSGTSDGRTEALLEPYVDPYIEQCKYDSKLFKPAIDTCHGDPNVPVTELGLVRMPVLPEHFQRTLPGALWNKKWGPFTKRLGLCIIHGLMRTGESNFEGCTMLLRKIFAGNEKTRTCA